MFPAPVFDIRGKMPYTDKKTERPRRVIHPARRAVRTAMNQESNYDASTDLYHVPCIGTPAGKTRRPFSPQKPVTVRVPGSKSITNRALLLATLADAASTLEGVLFSDDSRHFLKCIQELGFETAVDEAAQTITVVGQGGSVPRREASLYVGSAGTAARFLTAFLGLSDGIYHMDASEQMRRRPMAPLLASLQTLGCKVRYEGDGSGGPVREGFFPFTLEGHGFAQNSISVDIAHSSQFLSALLISSCLCGEDFTVRVEGSHGMSYIDMTCRMMEQFGVTVRHPAPDLFVTPRGQSYRARNYPVEPDVSAACYFYACSPLLGIPVLVEHVYPDSLQGDVAFLNILERMGCSLARLPEGMAVLPPENGFHGVEADMSACSDQAITLAAIAPFADTPTVITGIGHIRYQESDRIHAIVTELGRMGIRCAEDIHSPGSVTIYPGIPDSCTVETYEDHRMAMGFSLPGLRVPGIAVRNPGCCRKTFENYFQTLEAFIASIQS